MNEFPLTPHTFAILTGNGLPEDSKDYKDGRGMKLICSAPICIHATGQSNDWRFERKITVMGRTKCPRCKRTSESMEYCALTKTDSMKRKQIPVCPYCGKFPIKIIFTQWVVSKHRKKNHYYYHAECYHAMFLGESGSVFTPKRYRTRYAGAHGGGVVVSLPFDPRKRICEGCGKSVDKGEIKLTSLHHWKYAYKPSTVQANPILVLDNTSELCFACHQIADGFRGIMRMGNERIINVASLMPQDLKDRFKSIAKLYLQYKGMEYGKGSG